MIQLLTAWIRIAVVVAAMAVSIPAITSAQTPESATESVPVEGEVAEVTASLAGDEDGMSIELIGIWAAGVAVGMAWFSRKKYGKQILEAARAGKEPLKSIVNTARQEGAEDEDIEEWWDFPEKFRQSIMLRENAFRLTMFQQLIEEEEKSEDEAALMVKKTFPIYGRTGVEEEEKRDAQACKELGLTEKSRMLPPELRGRVDIYREKMGAQKILSLAKEYESYNAFLRDKIKEGKL